MFVGTKHLLKPRIQVWLLFALALFLLVPKIGDGILANYDDCYYAQKAKEILSSGDWLTLHYAGRPRFDNPPLFFWLMAVAFKTFGVSKFAAIISSALAGIFSIVLTYAVARFFFAPPVAYLSSFLLLTTPYFTKHARRSMLDVFVAFLYLLAFWAFIKGVRRADEGRRPAWFLLAGFGVGCAIMTKSIIGVLPLFVMVGFLLATGRAKLLYHPLSLVGFAVMILTVLPWYLGQYLLHGAAFLDGHFGRLLYDHAVAGKYSHYAWYDHFGYLRDMLRNGWPWVLPFFAGLAWHAVRSFGGPARAGSRTPAAPPGGADGISATHRPSVPPDRVERDASIFLTLWGAGLLAILSLAEERMLRYIIPLFPAMAIAAASMLGGWFGSEERQRRLVALTSALLALAAAVIVLTPIRLSTERNTGVYRLAIAAREVVPPGDTVLNLDQYYWSVSNTFLFYSGRDVTEPIRDRALFVKEASSGRFGLVTQAAYESLFPDRTEQFPVVARSDGWVLFRGAVPGSARD
jgi:4-amino-4-deoxy-L-arabinose transferase-like glycosyltransferase